MDAKTLDIVAQWGIGVLGITAIVLVAKKNKWGFVLGLMSQPFFFATSIINHQYGVLIAAIGYTVSWVLGIYE